MAESFYDLRQPGSGMNYRWIQPPQIAYFITTMDRYENPNSMPVTLGTCVSVDMEQGDSGNYYYTFALGSSSLPHVPPRQSLENLEQVPQCVLSYAGRHLFRETQVASLPLPKGISEIDLMGLTELPSRIVQPPGIRECKVNIEMEIESSIQIGVHYRLFVARAVGVSVDEKLLVRDCESDLHAGIFYLDPWFEVTVLAGENRPPRIHMARLDPDSVQRLPDDFGPSRTFVGSFENWMQDEVDRGSLTMDECRAILKMNDAWQARPDPRLNARLKSDLTRCLKALIPSE